MFRTEEEDYQDRLALQGQWAYQFQKVHVCPGCQRPVRRLEALALVQGSGYLSKVRIELKDGEKIYIEARSFNPQTMLWADSP